MKGETNPRAIDEQSRAADVIEQNILTMVDVRGDGNRRKSAQDRSR